MVSSVFGFISSTYVHHGTNKNNESVCGVEWEPTHSESKVCTLYVRKKHTQLFFRSFFRNNQPNNHWSHAFLGDMALLWTCSQASFFKRPASKLKDLYQGRRCIQFLKALLHFLCDAWYKHPNFISVRIKDSHYVRCKWSRDDNGDQCLLSSAVHLKR